MTFSFSIKQKKKRSKNIIDGAKKKEKKKKKSDCLGQPKRLEIYCLEILCHAEQIIETINAILLLKYIHVKRLIKNA